MAINPNYISYNVELTSDELESGVLQSESAEAITLLQAGGRKVVVPRPQIKRIGIDRPLAHAGRSRSGAGAGRFA